MTDSLHIEIGLDVDDSNNVGDVLGSPGQRLHDDEILGSCDSDREITDVDEFSAIDDLGLKGQCAERGIKVGQAFALRRLPSELAPPARSPVLRNEAIASTAV